jgi:hypothetical protein
MDQATEVVTYLEFTYLGQAKPLTYVLREEDTYEDRGDHYYMSWVDSTDEMRIFKGQLISFGSRIVAQAKVGQGQTAVEKVVEEIVEEIRQKEARAQGAQGKAAPPAGAPFQAAKPQPAAAAVDPADLRARSPIGR